MNAISEVKMGIKIVLGNQKLTGEQYIADDSNHILEQEFKQLQAMADLHGNKVVNTEKFNENLAKLVIKYAENIHDMRMDKPKGYRKVLLVDLKTELDQGHVYPTDLYATLLALTHDMHTGDIIFDDVYRAYQDPKISGDDAVYTESMVLLQIAMGLSHLEHTDELVIAPEIEFELIDGGVDNNE